MRCQILASIASFFLRLQVSSAAPVDDGLQRFKRDTPNTTRCMTPAEIADFQAHWPKNGGHGPVLVACDNNNNNSTNVAHATSVSGTSFMLPASEIEALAQRYLADARSTQSDGTERGCMTESQISAFGDAWPKDGGMEPALLACST